MRNAKNALLQCVHYSFHFFFQFFVWIFAEKMVFVCSSSNSSDSIICICTVSNYHLTDFFVKVRVVKVCLFISFPFLLFVGSWVGNFLLAISNTAGWHRMYKGVLFFNSDGRGNYISVKPRPKINLWLTSTIASNILTRFFLFMLAILAAKNSK